MVTMTAEDIVENIIDTAGEENDNTNCSQAALPEVSSQYIIPHLTR